MMLYGFHKVTPIGANQHRSNNLLQVFSSKRGWISGLRSCPISAGSHLSHSLDFQRSIKNLFFSIALNFIWIFTDLQNIDRYGGEAHVRLRVIMAFIWVLRLVQCLIYCSEHQVWNRSAQSLLGFKGFWFRCIWSVLFKILLIVSEYLTLNCHNEYCANGLHQKIQPSSL